MPKNEQQSFTHSELVAILQRERTRTLAILGTFLGVEAGEPGSGKVTLRDQELIGVILRRIDSRDVIKVMYDEEPVVQHQPEDEKRTRGPSDYGRTPFEKRVHKSILTESRRAA